MPRRQLHLLNLDSDPLSEDQAARFRSAVGSAIYLAADWRDIQFAIKELARRMSAPRVCDWTAARVLGSYLNRHPKIVKVITLDAGITARDELRLAA